jgi:hypothetical protein
MQAFGITLQAPTMSIPARYVIDRNGTIVDAEGNADCRYRNDPEATLAVVAELTTSVSSP